MGGTVVAARGLVVGQFDADCTLGSGSVWTRDLSGTMMSKKTGEDLQDGRKLVGGRKLYVAVAEKRF